jgi:hypothetical protein
MISLAVLLLQIALSFTFVFVARAEGWSEPVQAAGPAAALAFSLTIGSVAKAVMLRRLLGAPVVSIRPSFFVAIGTAALVGAAFTSLPRHYEWAELSIGMPAILVTFLFVMIKFGFSPEDRALFRKTPADAEPTLPATEKL